MSQADVERFTDDLKKDPNLLDEVKQHSGTLARVVAFAASKGYHFTLDEAKEYLSSKAGRELDDAQLDAVAGGKGHSPPPPPPHHVDMNVTSNINVQTTVNVTTVVEAAEVETTALVGAEAVAGVVVVVAGAIVLI